MDKRWAWCAVVLAFAATGCSGSSDRRAHEPRRATESPSVAPAAVPASTQSTPAAPPDRGLRASYEACIDRAAAVIPATQACIDDEGEFQRSRLDAIVERLKREHPERTGALDYQQAGWRADLETRCAWDANAEGQQQRIEANMCTLEETAKRADALDQ